MIGIVLWCDPRDQKAVFWCEDQGDLAYYDNGLMLEETPAFFDAGDMVQFDVSSDRKMRKAHHPRLLHQHACADLPSSLRKMSWDEPHPSVPQSATIIPFASKDDGVVSADKSARKA